MEQWHAVWVFELAVLGGLEMVGDSWMPSSKPFFLWVTKISWPMITERFGRFQLWKASEIFSYPWHLYNIKRRLPKFLRGQILVPLCLIRDRAVIFDKKNFGKERCDWNNCRVGYSMSRSILIEPTCVVNNGRLARSISLPSMLHCQLARKSEAFLRVRTESEPQSVNQRERWLVNNRPFIFTKWKWKSHVHCSSIVVPSFLGTNLGPTS